VSGNSTLVSGISNMSRSPLSVTADILDLRILINDVIESLKKGRQLPSERREALSESFRRYIRNAGDSRVRPNGLSSIKQSMTVLPSSVVRQEAAADGERILSAAERYAAGSLPKSEVKPFVAFLVKLDTALDQSRSRIRISRYL
jgi:hypothetical protein